MKTRHHPRANRAGVRAAIAVAVIAFVAAAVLPQAAQAQAAVAVLQSEMAHVKAAIVRIDKRLDRIDNRLDRMDARFERMDQTIAEIKETAARTDERINGLQAQSNLIVTVLVAVLVPLHLATLAALFGLLTKGTYWGRERAPKSAGTAHRGGAQPVATPA